MRQIKEGLAERDRSSGNVPGCKGARRVDPADAISVGIRSKEKGDLISPLSFPVQIRIALTHLSLRPIQTQKPFVQASSPRYPHRADRRAVSQAAEPEASRAFHRRSHGSAGLRSA